MARRKNRFESAMIGILFVVAIPFLIIEKIIKSIGVTGVLVGLVAIVIVIGAYFTRKKNNRLKYLRAKYGDESIVQRIMNRHFWQGQTVDQLRDSLGEAASVDNNLLKTRKREIWKYQPNGKNRYRLRITLDDDVVVAWDQKN